jgi:tRNA dimethylallyltransferase
MFNRLKEVDPDEAAKTHPNNTVRVLRALEIFCLTGKTKSQLQASGTYKRSNFEFSFYCLAPPRQMLYDRINRRVDTMIEHGLLQEIEELVSRGKAEQIRRAGVIGYTEMLDHIEGVYTLDEAISLTKQNHRRYAKRQMTWFRRQLPVTMFSDIELLLKAMKSEITF